MLTEEKQQACTDGKRAVTEIARWPTRTQIGRCCGCDVRAWMGSCWCGCADAVRGRGARVLVPDASATCASATKATSDGRSKAPSRAKGEEEEGCPRAASHPGTAGEVDRPETPTVRAR